MQFLTFATFAAVTAAALPAQQASIPVVQLGESVAKGTEIVATGSPMRAMSTGAVLLNDPTRRRLLLFEPSLTSFKVISDSTKGATGPLAQLATGIIPFTGDSSLMIDPQSQSLLVIAPDGGTARVMAPPKQNDIYNIGGNALFGAPAFDANGRLVYRANYPPNFAGFTPGGPPPQQPDTAPIVRADFDTRVVDTIAVIKIPMPGKILAMDMNAGGTPKIKLEINPMPLGNEWALLADGTLAIVHAQDYHVEFVDPDGKKRTAPKMPFAWRRATDEEKQTKIDSVRVVFDSTLKAQTANLPAGVKMPTPELVFPKLEELPDYHPPIRPGSVRADADGYLWILPTTSTQSGAGPVYDVVNRDGKLFQRVQFPPQTSIAGFAKGGVVYLYRFTDASGTKATLERASVNLTKGATN